MSEYIELATDIKMISCWIAGNNRWKCACHNTVLEHTHLIHICLHPQVSSFLTAETIQWLYLLAGENFQSSDHVGRATKLGHNQRPLPSIHIRGTYASVRSSSPSLTWGHAVQSTTSWHLTATCQGVALVRGGGERLWVLCVFER